MTKVKTFAPSWHRSVFTNTINHLWEYVNPPTLLKNSWNSCFVISSTSKYTSRTPYVSVNVLIHTWNSSTKCSPDFEKKAFLLSTLVNANGPYKKLVSLDTGSLLVVSNLNQRKSKPFLQCRHLKTWNNFVHSSVLSHILQRHVTSSIPHPHSTYQSSQNSQ